MATVAYFQLQHYWVSLILER